MGKGYRRPKRPLNARFVATVDEPGKYFDGQGLFLRVTKTLSRQWVQRITVHGKRTEIGLGSPPAVSLAKAREMALENRGKAMTGGDPLAEKRKARAALTFGEAVDRYLEAKLTEFKNEKHGKQWSATLKTYALPVLGKMRVADITVQDVLRVLEPIWQEKTETAKRLRGRIESVLSWTTVAGYRTGDNPARWNGNLSEILPKPSRVAKTKHHPSVALTDLPRWWAALSKRAGTAARALEFLTLTGARSGEVRGMTWDEVDLGSSSDIDATGETEAVWTIPAHRMKNGREHRVPLSIEAAAFLRSLPRMKNDQFVFPAPRGGPLSDMSISGVMRRMQEAEEKAGRKGFLDPQSKRPAVPHGLRSTFRQWTAERGYPRDMAEIALAHWIGSDVERAYQRTDMLERRRAMMSDWASFLRGQRTEGGNVVQLLGS